MTGYATRDVSEPIGLNADQVRHYVRRGLLTPARGGHGEYLFFIPGRRVAANGKRFARRAGVVTTCLSRIAEAEIGTRGGQSLSAVRIFADGNNVVVREDSNVWNAESGQGHLNFAVSELEGDVASLQRRRDDGKQFSDELDSDDWYNLGLDLEEADPDRAPEAYLRAISLDPKNADAHVNLGRLYQMRPSEAGAPLLSQSPRMCGRPPTRVVQPRHVVRRTRGTRYRSRLLSPRAANPDAHYNLARICEMRGDELAALRHLRRYQQLLDATD
jgi:tetratricopeptide (TPR) repeat protein